MGDQLQGLIVPPENTGIDTVLWLSLFLGLCLLVIGFLRWKKNQQLATTIALKKINTLRNQPVDSKHENQKQAIQLVQILCEGLQVKHLDQYQTEDKKEWETFRKKLDLLCYSAQPTSKLDPLVLDAKRWIIRAT